MDFPSQSKQRKVVSNEDKRTIDVMALGGLGVDWDDIRAVCFKSSAGEISSHI